MLNPNQQYPIECKFHDEWQSVEALRDPLTHQIPPGTMFYIHFSPDDARSLPEGGCSNHEPPCQRHLMVVCPDGHWWDIDSRASNCTMKEDKVHRCWVRHGEPPNITADKNGVTCEAGAGSIQTPDWHGFLRDGKLVL